ncbi:MAG: hypothetical protein JRJ29_01440 [Deltaproteobacteria bacterium]|nr:hypothetical protein [Deltaproteobacteria bacterium]
MEKESKAKAEKLQVVKPDDLKRIFGEKILGKVDGYVSACSCTRCGKC